MSERPFWSEATPTELPTRLSNPVREGILWQATELEFLLNVPAVGRFYVGRRQSVRVARESGISDDQISLFVLGLPLAAHFVQRGFLTLHGAAFATSEGAVVVVGGAACGKSTLLAGLARRGYPILADEVVPIVFSGKGVPQVHPGMPEIFLWKDAALRLGYDPGEWHPVRSQLCRYLVPGLPRRSEPAPPAAVIVLSLSASRSLGIEEIRGHDRFLSLHRQTCFNNVLVEPDSQTRELFRRGSSAFHIIPVRRVFRPRGHWCLEELLDLIEGEISP